MEDIIGIIVAVVVIYNLVATESKKKKKAAQGGKAVTAAPYAPNRAPAAPLTTPATPAAMPTAIDEEMFRQEMEIIKERAKKKWTEKKAKQAAAVRTSAQTYVSQEGGDPCHDELYTPAAVGAMEGVDPCHDELYTPAAVGAMEGVDPCHDGMYENDAYRMEDAYANMQEENTAQAQEWARAVVLAEILKRPECTWRARRE